MRPPQDWRRAKVTLGLTAVIAAAWLILSAAGLTGWATLWGGFIPARIEASPPGYAPIWLTPLIATLVHANFAHVALNLIIIAFCGRPTENVIGPLGIVILYLAGAFVAASAYYLLDPGGTLPRIGASGPASAIVGAFAMLFGRNKVKVANPRLALWLNALWLMAAWIVLQLILGLTFAQSGVVTSIASHIAGFLVGVLLANPLLLFRFRKA